MKNLVLCFLLLISSLSFAQTANDATVKTEIAPSETVQTETAKENVSDSLQTTTTENVEVVQVEEKTEFQKLISWLLGNWQVLLSAIFPLLLFIARLTPTEKDNDILRIIQSWLDILIPNNKKGGGTFVAYKKPEKAPSVAYSKPKKEGEEMTNNEN